MLSTHLISDATKINAQQQIDSIQSKILNDSIVSFELRSDASRTDVRDDSRFASDGIPQQNICKGGLKVMLIFYNERFEL